MQSEKTVFDRQPCHEEESQKIKEELINDKYLHAFDPNLPIEIFSDCSHLNSMAYCLTQPVTGGTHRIIKCGSTKLTDAQSRWVKVELELASVVFALEKCYLY